MYTFDFIISAVLLLGIDSIYLTLSQNIFKKQIMDVQKTPLQLNIWGAILSYLFLIIGINYFIIYKEASVFDAFVLGIVVYGVYEATTYALLKKWRIHTMIIDTLWGGILFALVTFFTYELSENTMKTSSFKKLRKYIGKTSSLII